VRLRTRSPKASLVPIRRMVPSSAPTASPAPRHDLKAADVALFAAIAFQLENVLLRAWVCNLVSLCGKPRDTKFALGAIDACFAISPQHFGVSGGRFIHRPSRCILFELATKGRANSCLLPCAASRLRKFG